MSIIAIAHTGFTVTNIDLSIGFYQSLGLVCKFRVIRNEEFIGKIVGMKGAEIEIAYMGMPGEKGHFLELLEYKKPRMVGRASATNIPGNGHICFEVDDLNLVRYSVTGYAEIPDGPNQGIIVAYIKDPDGFTVELLERPKKATLVVSE